MDSPYGLKSCEQGSGTVVRRMSGVGSGPWRHAIEPPTTRWPARSRPQRHPGVPIGTWAGDQTMVRRRAGWPPADRSPHQWQRRVWNPSDLGPPRQSPDDWGLSKHANLSRAQEQAEAGQWAIRERPRGRSGRCPRRELAQDWRATGARGRGERRRFPEGSAPRGVTRSVGTARRPRLFPGRWAPRRRDRSERRSGSPGPSWRKGFPQRQAKLRPPRGSRRPPHPRCRALASVPRQRAGARRCRARPVAPRMTR